MEDTHEAIYIANNTRFGRRASAWTEDADDCELFTNELCGRSANEPDAGTVPINSMVASNSRLSFGGVKMPGYGRQLAALGIREFVNGKTVFIQ